MKKKIKKICEFETTGSWFEWDERGLKVCSPSGPSFIYFIVPIKELGKLERFIEDGP